MTRLKEIVGKKFNKLTVLEFAENRHEAAHFLCLCECGKTKIIHGSQLKRGIVKSCGCLPKGNNRTHGDSKTKFYKVWIHMIQRCYHTNNPGYYNYGGRGIFVGEEWKSSYLAFKRDMFVGYAEGLQLDRINNNDGYYKENCRWVTPKQNNNNKRSNCYIECYGEIRTAIEWARIFHQNPSAVAGRYLSGLRGENAIFGKQFMRKVNAIMKYMDMKKGVVG